MKNKVITDFVNLYNSDKHAAWLVYKGYYDWYEYDCPCTENSFSLQRAISDNGFIDEQILISNNE